MLLRASIQLALGAVVGSAPVLSILRPGLFLVGDPVGDWLVERPCSCGCCIPPVAFPPGGLAVGQHLTRGGRVVATGVSSTTRGLEAATAATLAQNAPDDLPYVMVWVGGNPVRVPSGPRIDLGTRRRAAARTRWKEPSGGE